MATRAAGSAPVSFAHQTQSAPQPSLGYITAALSSGLQRMEMSPKTPHIGTNQLDDENWRE